GFWDRPEVTEALTGRDLGTVIRHFRRWTGATQTDVSILTGLPQPHVSELERGARRVTALALFERFADGLGAPRRLLGLADGPGRPEEAAGLEARVLASQREWLGARRSVDARHSQR